MKPETESEVQKPANLQLAIIAKGAAKHNNMKIFEIITLTTKLLIARTEAKNA